MRWFTVIIRSMVAFVVLLVFARLMGKKHISQITFFDYVTGISIGSIASSISIEPSISIEEGIISLAVWSGLTIAAGYISLISNPAMKLIDGEPTLVINNGKILESKMAKIQYNVEDLMMLLRNQGIFDPSEVEFALLESNGKLSVLKKSQFQPVTPQDLNIPTSYRGLVTELVLNGKIMEQNLQKMSLDKDWLLQQLQNRGIENEQEVVLAALDTNGNLFIDLKNDFDRK